MIINKMKCMFVPIDMQLGIVNTTAVGPYPMVDVVANNNKLVDCMEEHGIDVSYVNVAGDLFKYIGLNQDETRDVEVKYPEDFADIILKQIDNSQIITKYTPSAFYNTQLDSLLRFKGYDTIILSGVITSNGVYATALDAYQRGYKIVVVEDAMTDRETEIHNFFIEKMYPKFAKVMTTEELISELASSEE